MIVGRWSFTCFQLKRRGGRVSLVCYSTVWENVGRWSFTCMLFYSVGECGEVEFHLYVILQCGRMWGGGVLLVCYSTVWENVGR